MPTRWSASAATSAGQALRLGAEQPRRRRGQQRSASSRLMSPSSVVASTCRPADRSCGDERGGVGFDDHRHREDAARRRAQALAVVRVHAVAGEDHRGGAHRVGEPDQRAGVTGFGRGRRRPRTSAGWSASTSARSVSGSRAHRDQPRRSHRLRQRLRRPLGHRVHRQAGQQRAVALRGGLVGGEHLVDQAAPRRRLDQVRALDEEAPSTTTPGVALQFNRSHHPGGSFSECRCQAASPEGALTSSGSAALATSTSAVNAAGSLTAISARFLRSTSTPAALRPWISRL